MAGREVSGPQSARGDLFQGRPWILCLDGVDPELSQMVRDVVGRCGAIALDRTVERARSRGGSGQPSPSNGRIAAREPTYSRTGE